MPGIPYPPPPYICPPKPKASVYCLVPGTGPSPSIRCAYSGFMPCGYMDISAASQMTGGDLRVSLGRASLDEKPSFDFPSFVPRRLHDTWQCCVPDVPWLLRRRIEDSFASCAGTSFLARTLMSAHVRQGESKVAHHHRIHSAHSHVHHSRIHAHTHPGRTYRTHPRHPRRHSTQTHRPAS